MRRTIPHLLWFLGLGLALTALACGGGSKTAGPGTTRDARDAGRGDASQPDGQVLGSTACVYGFTVIHANGRGIGAGCTDNSQCMYGVCLEPSTTAPDPDTGTGTSNGNTTNRVFGFCTRGCDCGNTAASQLSSAEKETWTCLYPRGHNGGWHHVVLKCTNAASCGNADTKWNICAMPLAGGTYPVCQAH